MASFWTNRGSYRRFKLLQGDPLPTNFYLALVKPSPAPSKATNLMSDLSEIAAGNGYTAGGFQITPGGTDMPTITEDDIINAASLILKDISWTASGGNIPASGTGTRYVVLTDDNATIANREVWAVWDLSNTYTISNGNVLTLKNMTLKSLD